METPAEALIRRDRSRKHRSTPSTTPNTAIHSLLSKQVSLHDWWLVKSNSVSHGKELGVGGFNHRESRGIRSFSSAPIIKRHDAVTLETDDGITILLHGNLNRSRTLENGFPREVSDDFLIGFPYYWEEFAAVSVSKGVSCSDACKTPGPADHRTSVPNMDNFEDATKTNYDDFFHRSGASSARKESSQLRESTETPSKRNKVNAEQSMTGGSNVEVVARSGPLTRSRTRKT
ncbi:hypothetical protein ACP275_08G041900 [Erythranthe tilingii]